MDSLGLSSFVKTTGGTGLHVLVPILSNLSFENLRSLCDVFGDFIDRALPGVLTREWQIKGRAGKLFFDCGQNARGKSIIAPYSPRALPAATVSMPLRWEELEYVEPTDFTIHTALARLRERGDPWESILSAKTDLMAAFQSPSASPST